MKANHLVGNFNQTKPIEIMNEEDALDNLTNTVLLSEGDEKFQFVYATQLYGSIFGLYANFQVRDIGDTATIEKIHLFGVNYKGPVCLGITRVSPPEVNGIDLELEVFLQANDTTVHTPVFTVNTDLEVTRDTELKVIRELDPMSGATYYDNDAPITDRSFVNGKFDSEFFARDGFFVRDKTPDWIQLREEDRLFPAISGLGGSNCKIGLSSLAF